MAYVPQVYVKTGYPDRTAYTQAEAYQLVWNGWRLSPDELPPPPDPWVKQSALTAALDAAAASANGTYVALTGAQTVAGEKTFSGDAVFTEKVFVNGESWPESAFDVDLTVMGAVRYDPVVQTTGLYTQHRVSGDLGAKVHEASGSELRVSNATNTDFLVGHETTTVVTGGVNAITDMRGLTVSSHFEGTPSGTITAYKGIVIQNQHALTGTLAVTTAYGLVVEQQTRAATNYTIYAPAGKTVLGTLDTTGSVVLGSATTSGIGLTLSTTTGTNPAIYWVKGGNNRWINWTETTESGGNAGSNLTWIARNDTGGNIGAVLTLVRSSRQVNTGGALSVAGGLGVNGTTPIAKRAATADATDLASVITLANALKADLVAYGLKTA